MNPLTHFSNRPFFIKLFNWEYWSFNAVYIWIYPIWILLCIRARSLFFFSASNPSIKNGGFLNESKKDIYAIMPQHLYPRTTYFDAGAKKQAILHQLREQEFYFPIIGKPDSGGRGRGVKLLRSEEDIDNYSFHTPVDFHIQEFITYKNEVGIFYYRYPDQASGNISGIVRKEFLKAFGDGIHSIRYILQKNKRALLQMKSLEKIYGASLDKVLKKGEELILAPYGNHARGAKFLDDSHLADVPLTQVIDDICKQVKDFYFGRLDIRYNDWEELKQGKNFSVIEVNGAGSEPTHMYDPRHSIFFAWKEIVRHWIILWRISRMNHQTGSPYLSIKEGIAMFREDKAHSAKLSQMQE